MDSKVVRWKSQRTLRGTFLGSQKREWKEATRPSRTKKPKKQRVGEGYLKSLPHGEAPKDQGTEGKGEKARREWAESTVCYQGWLLSCR